jgi:hypothetical protein
MKFLKIGLIAFIFLNFAWLQILQMIFCIEFFCYLRNNKKFLLENPNYIKIFFYNLISFYELAYYYFVIGYRKFKNNYLKFKNPKMHKKSIKNCDFNTFLDDLEKI